MTRLDRVVQILDEAVAGAAVVGPHGPFWRGKTIEQLIAHRVYGRKVIVAGAPDESALIQALEGSAPFGSGMENAPPGAIFARMPSGRPPVPADRIAFIRQWIADGCPDEEVEGGGSPPPVPTAEQHNAFWREFDDWAMFSATGEVQDAEGVVMGEAFVRYQAYAHDAAQLDAWVNAVRTAPAPEAIALLGERQLETIAKHYGDPIDPAGLLAGFELFGRGELPPDPLRPAHPNHRMDGAQMWFIWGSFVDACIRLPFRAESWHTVGKAILAGLLHDGVFRGRYPVTGFSADEAGKSAMRAFVTGLGSEELLADLRKRFLESGLFA